MSTRYAAAVVLLLTLVLVPTVVHNYLGVRRDDGRRAIQVADGLNGFPWTDRGTRGVQWAVRRFDSRDWAERAYAAPDGSTVRVSIVRTYDPKRVYHHPELAIAYGTELPDKSVVRMASMPDVPVHVLRGDSAAAPKMALYVLHYGDAFVENPLTFQFRLAGGLLVGGREPMTLIFVTCDDPRQQPLERSWGAQLLASAVERFRALGPAAVAGGGAGR
jgi:hypothetical protein